MFRKLYAGVYDLKIGDPAHPGPITGSIPPRENALSALGDCPLPDLLSEIETRIAQGKIIISLPLAAEERIYGMGLQYFRQNQRGRTRYLRVNSDPVADNGESNAPAAFYLSTAGYALLVDTSRIVTAFCGSTARTQSKPLLGERDNNTDPEFTYTPPSDRIELSLGGDGVRLVLFAGRTLLELVQRYNLFCGGGVLPPKWALGFWHRVDSKCNADQVLEEATAFRERNFPCDVFGLEPGWQSNSYPCSLEWSAERFPDPDRLCQALRGLGIRVNAWQHPYLSEKCPVYREIMPYCGDYTVWGGLVPDLTIESACRLMQTQWTGAQLDKGVSGMKLDECDGSELSKFSWIFPAHAAFPGGDSGEVYRQKLGCLCQLKTAELFRERGIRTFGLSRASGAGVSPLPYGIYTDLYDHKQFIREIANASYCGMLWVPEVRGAESTEDWIRRFQTAVFAPIAQLNGWCDGLKPWSFPEAEETVRRFIELRIRLIPYLYSLFHEYECTGKPVFRAMNLVPGVSAAALSEEFRRAAGYRKTHVWDTFEDELDGQYMLGDRMLIAPLTAGEREKLIYLPEGVWYDFFTGQRFTGGRFLRRQYTLEEIPVFVREGSLIPLADAASCTRDADGALTIAVFGREASCELYDDDGESFGYLDGEYGMLQLSTAGPGTESVEKRGRYQSKYYVKKWIYLTEGI